MHQITTMSSPKMNYNEYKEVMVFTCKAGERDISDKLANAFALYEGKGRLDRYGGLLRAIQLVINAYTRFFHA